MFLFSSTEIGYVDASLLSSKCVELETPPSRASAIGYLDKGQLIDDHRAIAKRYLKSWFIPDIVVTIIDVVAGRLIFWDVLSKVSIGIVTKKDGAFKDVKKTTTEFLSLDFLDPNWETLRATSLDHAGS